MQMKMLWLMEPPLFREPGAATRDTGKVCFGDLEIDDPRRSVKRRGRELKLTCKEYDLLLFFIRSEGLALTRDVILNEVWGIQCYPHTRTVDAHVAKLRRMLEPDPRAPRHLVTIHRFGYRFLTVPSDAGFNPPDMATH